MDLPVDFYDGRHDPDHGQCLSFFLATMGEAAETLRWQAVALYSPEHRPAAPWETLHRVQQQLLTRLMTRGQVLGGDAMTFSPGDIRAFCTASRLVGGRTSVTISATSSACQRSQSAFASAWER